jgi:hypothetical protein
MKPKLSCKVGDEGRGFLMGEGAGDSTAYLASRLGDQGVLVLM